VAVAASLAVNLPDVPRKAPAAAATTTKSRAIIHLFIFTKPPQSLPAILLKSSNLPG
jgi:hypothetical protein